MRSELETALLARIDAQAERIRQLEEVLAPSSINVPIEWCLTGSEAAVFACLAARKIATKDMIYHALYATRTEDIEPKIVDVFIHKLRRKVVPFGVVIETLWGSGYYLQNREKYLAVAA
ncbi:helix-turn-helix domain-containing protein [Ochrobactrum sp. S46]|nr:helix-turn-helix domain-containing protein [Ochrobactrum sp. S45]MBK0042322.1 helix-turn-helix domain-containing protein [Ochrobactrum sp. S46]